MGTKIFKFALLFVILNLFTLKVQAQIEANKHKVASGETLSSIALKYSTTEEKLIELNPGARQFIYVGMELIIPNGDESQKTDLSNERKELKSKNKKTKKDKRKSENEYNPFSGSLVLRENTQKNVFNSTEKKSPAQKGFDGPILQSNHSGRNEKMFYLAAQIEGGYSTFMCDEVSVNGTLSFGGELQLQYYNKLESNGYHAQIGLGFQEMGAADFTKDYLMARIYPVGWSYSLNDYIRLIAKAGGYIGYSLNDLESSRNSFSQDIEYGVGLGFSVDYKLFNAGVSAQYGLSEVAPDSQATLRNLAFTFTLSYKFGKL